MTDEERDYYEERAAIREYDGGLSRDEAEDAALLEMKKKYRNKMAIGGTKTYKQDTIPQLEVKGT